jgi:antitoxin (DNA-binding transcriptional repressor) of toxin-antitoxin stability system
VLRKGYYGHMKTASVSELKNGLSSYLRAVISGETVVVTDRKKPVAMFRPIDAVADDEELASLIAAGIVSPPEASLDIGEFFEAPLAVVPGGLAAAVVEERDEQ